MKHDLRSTFRSVATLAAVIFCILLLMPHHAGATLMTYTYTGNDLTKLGQGTGVIATNPFTSTDYITISFTANLGNNTEYSNSGGGSADPLLGNFVISVHGTSYTMTPTSNGAGYSYDIWTGSNGQITSWEFATSYNPSIGNFLDITVQGGPEAAATIAAESAPPGPAVPYDDEADYFTSKGADPYAENSIAGSFLGDPAPVPEPNTLCLVALGLVGLAATRKWKRS